MPYLKKKKRRLQNFIPKGSLFIFKIYLLIFFIYFFLAGWVFVAVRGLSLVAVGGGGLLFVAVHRLLIAVASLVAEHGL